MSRCNKITAQLSSLKQEYLKKQRPSTWIGKENAEELSAELKRNK